MFISVRATETFTKTVLRHVENTEIPGLNGFLVQINNILKWKLNKYYRKIKWFQTDQFRHKSQISAKKLDLQTLTQSSVLTRKYGIEVVITPNIVLKKVCVEKLCWKINVLKTFGYLESARTDSLIEKLTEKEDNNNDENPKYCRIYSVLVLVHLRVPVRIWGIC